MSDPIDNLIKGLDALAYDQRTIVPGIIDELEPSSPEREQTVDFRIGIGNLASGEPEDLGIAPSVPMMSIGSGGYFFLMPAGGEGLGLVVDRASGLWRANKTPGQADRVNGKRSKSLSDICVAPFQYTAPDGAPSSWESLLLGGPAGVAIELDEVGAVTITKQGEVVATISLTAAGSVNIEVADGQLVNLGDLLAQFLTKWAPLLSAMTAMLSAGAGAVGSPGDPSGENAGLAFAAAQAAWESAIAGNSPECGKVKGS